MTLLLPHTSLLWHKHTNFFNHANNPLSVHDNCALFSCISNLNLRAPFKCFSSKNKSVQSQKFLEGFSVLETDTPWNSGDLWSTMALYFFSLHIPFSFGGLSVVANILHQPNLEPETKAVSLLVIQTLELFSVLLLLQFTAKLQYKLASFIKPKKLPCDRNWLLAAALGVAVLISMVFVTSCLVDRFVESKAVNNLVLKEILSSGGSMSAAACILYCYSSAGRNGVPRVTVDISCIHDEMA